MVNIGSIVGETGFKELSGYSSTKEQLKAHQCLALEYIKDKIRLCCQPRFHRDKLFKNFKEKKSFITGLYQKYQ